MKQFSTLTYFENMDEDIHNKFALKLYIAIVCAIISLLCFYGCYCVAPTIIRMCSEESNVQEHQSRDEIEMEQLGRENNPDDTSNTIRNEQPHIQFCIENVL